MTDLWDHTFACHIEPFIGYLARNGRSPRTAEKYRHTLELFAEMAGDRAVGSTSATEIDEWLRMWHDVYTKARGRPPSAATYRNHVAALRSFYSYLERFDVLRDDGGRLVGNPMARIIAPAALQRANDWLRPPEDRALLSVSCLPQERIFVWFLRWTGLRVGEACSILVADLDLSPGYESVTVRRSKTAAGNRTVALVPELVPQIHQWLHHSRRRGLCYPSAPLFVTRHGTASKPSYVWRVVKRVAHRAGVRPVPCTCSKLLAGRHEMGCRRTQSGENLSEVTPHTLRRTFGSDLLNRGLRLEVVSQLLGHATTAVTERAYAQLMYETARRELLQVLGH